MTCEFCLLAAGSAAGLVGQPTKEYLDEREVAAIYSLSVPFLRKRRHHGGGPAFSKIGRKVLYARASVESWLADHRRTSTSDDGRSA
ncbi:helix-turn-helix transcriptional regulator [Azospirillum sp. B2RO_4]|uniref:helix-turn-helix transcriptional regulator n=1 Tax=Azospirillum sp. B2RO_4 TaxID=3027796 RepID=UPI003DA81B6B